MKLHAECSGPCVSTAAFSQPCHWPSQLVGCLPVGWLVPAVGPRELRAREGLGGPVVAGSPGVKLPGRSQRKTELLIPARNRSR